MGIKLWTVDHDALYCRRARDARRVAETKRATEALAKKYDALTLVDDAHGEGVLGKGGRGVVNHFGLDGEVDIEIGSLSKGVGCRPVYRDAGLL